MRTLNHTNVSFEKSTLVISSACKFVIPVIKGGGEPLVYPAGAILKGQPVGGQPILDWEGKPVGDTGVVFFNSKDRAYQAVADNGEGIIIINQVSQTQAEQIVRDIETYTRDPNGLTLHELKEVLDYVRNVLGLGDMYNSDRAFARKKLTRVEPGKPLTDDDGEEIEAYGWYKRDDRDICKAVYIAGAGTFDGSDVTGQEFSDGIVIVTDGKEVRGIDPDVFVQTYRHADGTLVKNAADIVRFDV